MYLLIPHAFAPIHLSRGSATNVRTSPRARWPSRIPTQTRRLRLEAEFKHGWCALAPCRPCGCLRICRRSFHFMRYSFRATLLSLSVLSAPIRVSGRELSAPIRVFDGENICVCAIRAICVIRYIRAICVERVSASAISVSSHIRASLNLFSGLTIHIGGVPSNVGRWDSGSGSRFRPERWISCEVAEGFQE